MAAFTRSRLESRARRPALDHLVPLAGALGVEVGELLGPVSGRDPRVHERPRTVEGMTIHPLSRALGIFGPQGQRVHLRARR
jgi:hypothetical protein